MGKLVIEEHEIEPAFADHRHRVQAVRAGFDLVPIRRERGFQDRLLEAVVLDHENAGLHGLAPYRLRRFKTL